MISVRKAAQRGHFDFGWLDTNHTFSFGEYHDPAHMGFRSLRVLNEDRVQAGKGFGNHGHRDMEILSYVLSGELSHKDNQGNTGVIRHGDVQRMTAGTGIMHSEFNASAKEPVHFLQIWIQPGKKGVPPRYEDRAFPPDKMKNRLGLIASSDEADGSLSVHQDVRAYATLLDAGKEVSLEVAEGRGIWVQTAKGNISIGHGFSVGKDGMDYAGEWTELKAGDGAAVQGERKLAIRAETDAEALVFDLA
ncbi:MAG: Pirin domain protein [Fibrobacteres bacterium]|nr:Pirin domain protein [Fibrobacterota bacterium]